MTRFQTFLVEYEGIDGPYDNDNDDLTEAEQLLADIDMTVEGEDCDQFFTKFGPIDGAQTVAVLNNQSVFHAVTKVDIFNELTEDSVYPYEGRYSATIF